MKSRRERASATRESRDGPEAETDVNSGPSFGSTIVCEYTRKADARVARTASAPSRRGQVCPDARLQPIAIVEKTATWTTLSPQKSSRPPQRDSWNRRRA